MAEAVGYFGIAVVVESADTTPLPAYDPYWNNVALLLHCDGSNGGTTFTDATGKTVSGFGGVTTAASAAKFGTTGMLGDGAGTYLSVPAHADFDFGSGNFTFECWIKPTSVTDNKYNQIIYLGATTTLALSQRNGVLTLYVRTGILNSAATSAVVSAGVWSHVACVRNGATLKIYVNGVECASSSISGAVAVPATALYIGTVNNVNIFSGGLDEIRLTKGVARYTSAPFQIPTTQFGDSTSTYAANIQLGITLVVDGVVDAVPSGISGSVDFGITVLTEGAGTASQAPSAPDPHWSNVSFLLKCDGEENGTVFTESTGKPVAAVGTAKTLISSAKFGFTGMLCDGSGYLTTPNHAGFDFGSGDFTIELWIKPDSVVGNSEYLVHNNPTKSFAVRRSDRIILFSWSTTGSDSFQIQTGNVLDAGVWSHVACVRSGTSMKVCVDGIEAASGTQSGALYTPTTPVQVGAASGVSPFFGSIDDIRITKGVARYTSTPFAPPAEAFPDASAIVVANVELGISIVIEGIADFFDIKASADIPLLIQVDGIAAYAELVFVASDVSILIDVDGTALFTTQVFSDGVVYVKLNVVGGAYFGDLNFSAAIDTPIVIGVDTLICHGVVCSGDVSIKLDMFSSAGRGVLVHADTQDIVFINAQCSHNQPHAAFIDLSVPLQMSCAADFPVDTPIETVWVKTSNRECFVYE